MHDICILTKNMCAISAEPVVVQFDQQRCASLTGVQLKQQLDGVVIQVAAVQDDLDEGGQATLACRRHRHRPRHV